MPLSRTRARLLAVNAAFVLSACSTLGPDFKPPLLPSWLADWSGGSLKSLAKLPAERQGSSSALSPEWWRSLDDPVLDALIDEALRSNPNVRIAGLRIIEARANLGIAGSTLYPQLQQISGEALRVGQRQDGGPNSAFSSYGLGFGIGWEIDFWGKFRRSIEAADASYFASLAQYDDVQVLMAAQVATLYASIRTLEVRLQIAGENAALQARSLQITERRFKSGNDAELDVQQAKSQYLSTLASIPLLESGLRQAQNALGTLLVRAPGPLPEMAAGRGRIPNAQLALIADLPADLLRRRPDVRAAEMQLAAQSALIGVSEAELYPAISLLGSLGVSGTSLSGSRNSFDWAIGPSLTWNVFDHGRLSNQVLVQDARFQQLFERYQETVLSAAREVDDAAVAFAKGREQTLLLAEAVTAARRSLAIANIQYREGLTGFERVLDSQRALFSQQEREVSALGDVAKSLIALYKAMGGGWQAGRSRPLLDDATRETMGERSDWQEMLSTPLPPAARSLPAGVQNLESEQ
ncbi:efflux transporter outer membrane subunit [Candidatus Accumulibacter sp. ACC003]|uniref:efflux transporter outer membrane subunit n=1 Tax=Candidatus Accumulibacter sp. ACC003 TaxID=2823334 RepID=UPI0025BBDA54|nr:efflux transporter outer membrane subunit [Candidatus Accumulibacter sp. ACC003]